jgi:hypothetical protein
MSIHVRRLGPHSFWLVAKECNSAIKFRAWLRIKAPSVLYLFGQQVKVLLAAVGRQLGFHLQVGGFDGASLQVVDPVQSKGGYLALAIAQNIVVAGLPDLEEGY